MIFENIFENRVCRSIFAKCSSTQHCQFQSIWNTVGIGQSKLCVCILVPCSTSDIHCTVVDFPLSLLPIIGCESHVKPVFMHHVVHSGSDARSQFSSSTSKLSISHHSQKSRALLSSPPGIKRAALCWLADIFKHQAHLGNKPPQQRFTARISQVRARTGDVVV